MVNTINPYFRYDEFVFVDATPLPVAPKPPTKGNIHTGQTILFFILFYTITNFIIVQKYLFKSIYSKVFIQKYLFKSIQNKLIYFELN